MKKAKVIQKLLKYSGEKFPLTRGMLEKKRLSKASRRIMDWKDGKTPRATEPVKYGNILDHAKRNQLRIMVETGTYHGDAIYSLRDEFDRIYSIELSDIYYKLTKYRLSCYGQGFCHMLMIVAVYLALPFLVGGLTHRLNQQLKQDPAYNQSTSSPLQPIPQHRIDLI